jgi:hypothetical protein
MAGWTKKELAAVNATKKGTKRMDKRVETAIKTVIAVTVIIVIPGLGLAVAIHYINKGVKKWQKKK